MGDPPKQASQFDLRSCVQDPTGFPLESYPGTCKEPKAVPLHISYTAGSVFCSVIQSILKEVIFLDTLFTLGVTWEHANDQGIYTFMDKCATPTPDGGQLLRCRILALDRTRHR